MRIVLDTNVLIAAALRGKFAESILEMADNNLMILITSEDILKELADKLHSKFNWKYDDIQSFVEGIREISYIVEVTKHIPVISRDPEDNKILECALSGKADLIVTADQDLIKLKTFKNIGIVHPKTLSWTFPEYFKKRK